MILPKPQAQQSLDFREYKNVVVVAGTRYYNDRKYFHAKIVEFVEWQTDPVLFVSGDAPSGADDLIIRWCDKFCYPCLRMPADWDNEQRRPNFNKKAAGFVRNQEMANIATYLLAFWDEKSPGTADMIERIQIKKIPYQIIKIATPQRPDYARRP